MELPRPDDCLFSDNCDFSIRPEREDGQIGLFMHNDGPYVDGYLPAQPFLVPPGSDCLEVYIFVRPVSPNDRQELSLRLIVACDNWDERVDFAR